MTAAAADGAVTVVMPTHNRARLMQDTLRSVLAQVDVDLRVVVVDDGSSDDTPAVLAAVSSLGVRSFRHDQARGVSNARNTGLAMVDTPWVAFVDDDDLWSPDKLVAQLSSLQEDHGAQWSCTGSVVTDSSLSILRHERPPRVTDLDSHALKNNCIPAGGSGVLAATELVRQVGGFDPAYSNLADWDLWIRLALASRVTSVARPLVAYRVQASGMAHGVQRTSDELDAIIEKYAAERTARGVSIDWGTWFRYFARLHLRQGDQRAAARDYFRAARHGRWTRVGVGALCFVVPGLTSWADRRSRWRLPRAWRDEAEEWLAPLRNAPPLVADPALATELAPRP